MATLDKLFYRCFKEDKYGFLEWIKNTGVMVIDEVHAGSGGYLTHVREFISVFKRNNPLLRVILTSATVKDVASFRDKFLPSAQIIQATGKRGIVRVMVLLRESLEQYIMEKIDPHLQKTGGICLVFVDNIQKVSQLVAKCNESLMKRTGLPLEVIKLNSPFLCISSQLAEQDKTDILQRIKNGSLRFLFTTSLLELGIDIPRIEHIINIGWPITGKNELLQRFGRLRFQTIEQKKNFTIILDTDNPLDNYYLENHQKIKEILEENISEQILFDSKSLQRMKAFVLFRVVMGQTTIEEILTFCHEGECERITRTATTMLVAQGILRTRKHKQPYRKRELVIADEKELKQFVRNHRIRSGERKWSIVERSQEAKREIKILGEIGEQRIIRITLPGNLLYQGRKGDIYRVVKLLEGKVLVEKLAINKTTLEQNKLKPPIFQIEKQARMQKKGAIAIQFGKMIIQRETAKINRYTNTGERIEEEREEQPEEEELGNWGKKTYYWQEKTSGILIEVNYPKNVLNNEQKKEALNLLKDLILKSMEIILHISESSFRTVMNVHENRIVIYDRGGDLGNAEYLFTKFQEIENQMKKLMQDGERNKQQLRKKIIPLMEKASEKVIKITRELLEAEEGEEE